MKTVIELDVIDPSVTCEGCGKCCMHMRTPPFIVYYEHGQFRPVGDDDSYEDCKRLLSAPHEARQVMVDGLFSDRPDESPCSWFDQEAKRCRWHEFRPDICRDYPVGGESCLLTRKGHS